MEGTHWVARKVIDSFSDDIYDTIKKTVTVKLTSGSIANELEALWIVDAQAKGDNTDQQWVLKEVGRVGGSG